MIIYSAGSIWIALTLNPAAKSGLTPLEALVRHFQQVEIGVINDVIVELETY